MTLVYSDLFIVYALLIELNYVNFIEIVSDLLNTFYYDKNKLTAFFIFSRHIFILQNYTPVI